MNETLQINPKFAQIIPPLSEDEFAQLEENILKLGRVIEPIQVWKGFIVDGHHRYKIVQKHPEITYTTCEREFESEIEAVDWICGYQLGRRNLNDIARKVLTAQKYQAIKQLGKFHGNQHTLPKKSGLVDNQPDHNAHGMRTVLANELGVTKIKAENEMFDPNFHNAVLTGCEEDKEDGIILEEYQEGFILKESKVIRHSVVKINKIEK